MRAHPWSHSLLMVVIWGALLGGVYRLHATNMFSPPPPNITAVAIAGFAIWLLVWWAAWADRHRGALSS